MLDRLDAMIEERHLLTHSFYTKWVSGTLPQEALRRYARQYYAFESEFPRFLSAIHSRSDRPDVRQALLQNLWDEEHGPDNHAELWLRFAEAIGADRDEVRGAEADPATRALVATYREAATSVVGGVAAIHAYEAQVPRVARAKIDGLRDHYGIEQGQGLRFWEVHEALDVEHSEAERDILEGLAEEEPEAAEAATAAALDAWWWFLDAVDPD